MNYTDHAKKRMGQRAVTDEQVRLAVKYGKKIHRQGMVFHVMRNKDLPDQLPAQYRGRLKNMVVVTCNDPCPVVITVYRSRKALKLIKRKSKILF